MSESYKTGRRIIHDIKYHNEALKKYIKNHEYEALDNHLTAYTDSIESTYASVGTGNLVIDSLITNYHNIASSKKIIFTTSIMIEKAKIPVSDYDLCIILGNLLDNSLHACEILPVYTAGIVVKLSSNISD